MPGAQSIARIEKCGSRRWGTLDSRSRCETNPLIILVALVVILFAWMLSRNLWMGEFRFGNGSYGRTTTTVRRADRPGAFWLLVAFQTGVILYVASLAFHM